MSYYIAREVPLDFDAAVAAAIAALKREGFGVLCDIDVKATIGVKLNLEFRPYRILGACNPPLAHRALQLEDRIGLMLPCNVIVQERTPGRVEVAAIDPVAAMTSVGNDDLLEVATRVREKLARVVASVGLA